MKSIVLICSHNGEKFIQDQVLSILNQSSAIDLIFIHDYNSTDSTRTILCDLKTKHPSKVKVQHFDFAISTTHSFLNSLNFIHNLLQEEAIIYLCDQDDYWLRDKNKLVHELFEGSNVEFIFHQVLVCDENLKPQKPFYSYFWIPQRDFKLPNQYVSNCVIGHTIAIKRSTLSKLILEFNENIPMHDWYISLQILITGSSWYYIDEPLSLYRQHNYNQLGSTNSPFKAINRMRIVGKLIHNFNKEINFSSVQEKKKPCIIQSILYVRPFFKLLFILISYARYSISKFLNFEK